MTAHDETTEETTPEATKETQAPDPAEPNGPAAEANDAADNDETAEPEHFDPAAALAELEAAMEVTDSQQSGSGATDNYIAILEDEVMQLTALAEAGQAAVQAANTRADEAHEQIEQAKARMQKESAVVLERRTRKVLLAFVEVLDNLERALSAARAMDHNPEVVAGIEMVQRSFLKTLQEFDVAKQAAMGERFDPALHDAVSMIPVDDDGQDGLVVAVTVDGYTVGDMLLRPAAVVVGKALK